MYIKTFNFSEHTAELHFPVTTSQWGHVTVIMIAVKTGCAFPIPLSPMGTAVNEGVGRWKQSVFLSHLVEVPQAVESSGPHQTLMSMRKKPLVYYDSETSRLIDHNTVQDIH